MTARLRLLVFTSETCGACVVLKRSGTLAAFAKAHPEVSVEERSVADKDGETPEGSEFAKNDALADEYNVKYLPTVILVTGDGRVLTRVKNSAPLTPAKLEEVYAAHRRSRQARRR